MYGTPAPGAARPPPAPLQDRTKEPVQRLDDFPVPLDAPFVELGVVD